MFEPKKQFEANGYVHLVDFLNKENCAELTKELTNLVKNKQTVKDDQCPLSDSVRDSATFDSLLEQLLPYVEVASGKKLYPTYAYARMYVPGEELEIHRDRPACEISVTLTLGYEGQQWPIYMGATEEKSNGNAIVIDVGDAVLYKGCEVFHWREKFQGKWQAQVFLHYVDVNGPHADQKYDGRKGLANHQLCEDDSFLYVSYENVISEEICKSIIEITERNNTHKGLVGSGGPGELNTNIRDVNKVQLSLGRGIGAILTGIGLNANQANWQFDITHSNQCDYLLYNESGHYSSHLDIFMQKNQKDCRKLTAIAFLNDDFEGGKLYLKQSDDKTYPPQKRGSVVVFPSFILHGVEPVTSGIRRSVVTWLVGPWFK